MQLIIRYIKTFKRGDTKQKNKIWHWRERATSTIYNVETLRDGNFSIEKYFSGGNNNEGKYSRRNGLFDSTRGSIHDNKYDRIIAQNRIQTVMIIKNIPVDRFKSSSWGEKNGDYQSCVFRVVV